MRNLLSSLLLAATCLAAQAQPKQPDPQQLLQAQRAAMVPLARLDGVWRGPAWALRMDGSRHELTHTERVGAFLDGSLKVIEGRSYDADGTVSFNALGVISYDVANQAYSLQSNAMGRAGVFPLTLTPTGYVWSIPAGPMTIRYTAVIDGDSWVETGEWLFPGRDPVKSFEMRLKRLGGTDWPAAGAVPMR